jgi:hypothetical protein
VFYFSPKPRIFALVIGIDKYQHITKLNGCVADAKDMVKFLTESMGVPSELITVLHDDGASREAILTALKSFESDDRIMLNDPILIFYAGHGAEARPPQGWDAGGSKTSIQMLLPQDFLAQTTTDEQQQGIPDISIAELLSRISRKRGNNIVCSSVGHSLYYQAPPHRLLFSIAASPARPRATRWTLV